MNIWAIIAAGGMGTRMNLPEGKSKQYLKLGRFPVLHHAISAFERCALVSTIAVAAPVAHLHLLVRMVNRGKFTKVHHFLQGGKERQDSIFNCIQVFKEMYTLQSTETKSQTVILIHDGARPLIQPNEIEHIARESLLHGAAVPAVKPKDTIKAIDESGAFFGKTLERDKLRQVQTPQGFKAHLIIEAHSQARSEKFYATDDAALIERYFPEQKIKIVDGGYHNLKITTPEDVKIAKAILKQLEENDANTNHQSE